MDWSEGATGAGSGSGPRGQMLLRRLGKLRTKRSVSDLAIREPLRDSAAEISGEQWKQRAEGVGGGGVTLLTSRSRN